MATIEALNWPCSSIFQVELVFGCFVYNISGHLQETKNIQKPPRRLRAGPASELLAWVKKGNSCEGGLPWDGEGSWWKIGICNTQTQTQAHTHIAIISLSIAFSRSSAHISPNIYTYIFYVYVYTYWLSKAIYSYLRLSTFYLYIYLIHLSNQSHLIPSI
jgi:hypothetical protein